MGKIEIMGFHQPPLPFSLMTPHTQTTPPNFTPYTSKDVEMITQKHLAQFIGQKVVLNKSKGGCNNSPSEDEG